MTTHHRVFAPRPLPVLAGTLALAPLSHAEPTLCQALQDTRDISRVYALDCCHRAQSLGKPGLSESLRKYQSATDTFFSLFILARTAEHAGEHEQLRQIHSDIRTHLKQTLGGSVIAYGPSTPGTSGTPGNAIQAFPTDFTIALQLNAAPNAPTIADLPTVIVEEQDYLQQAAGDAVLWVAQDLSGHPNGLFLDTTVIANNIVVPSKNNLISHSTQLWSGSATVTSPDLPGSFAVTLSKVLIGSSSPQPDALGGQWCLPTDLSISGAFAGESLSITLDKTNPRNTITLDAQGAGHFTGAVNLDLDTDFLSERLADYGPFWMVLPVQWNAQTSTLELDTTATLTTDQLFPLHESAAANPLPGEGVSPVLCGDPDQNGHNGLYDQWDAIFETWLDDLGCED